MLLAFEYFGAKVVVFQILSEQMRHWEEYPGEAKDCACLKERSQINLVSLFLGGILVPWVPLYRAEQHKTAFRVYSKQGIFI